MEELTPLLENLAQKLGTTSEYLWGVLLKQAPISAVSQLIQMLITIILGVVLFKLHKKFSEEGKSGRTLYWDKEELLTIPMFLAGIGFFILALFQVKNFDNIIYGFFNPEYWALNEVFSLLNNQI